MARIGSLSPDADLYKSIIYFSYHLRVRSDKTAFDTGRTEDRAMPTTPTSARLEDALQVTLKTNWHLYRRVSFMTGSGNKTGDADFSFTTALRTAISSTGDRRVAEDFLFLELWERAPTPGPAAALRVQQIRRANPELAAAIRHEIGGTETEGPARRV
jgi:hypothetical protein